jgi:hypothetical protein
MPRPRDGDALRPRDRLGANEAMSMDEPLLAGGPGPDETIREARAAIEAAFTYEGSYSRGADALGALDALCAHLSRVVGEHDQLREAANAVRDCRNVDGLEDHFEFALDELEKLAAVSSAGTAEETRQ